MSKLYYIFLKEDSSTVLDICQFTDEEISKYTRNHPEYFVESADAVEEAMLSLGNEEDTVSIEDFD